MSVWEAVLFVVIFSVAAVGIIGAIICEQRDREFVRRTFTHRQLVPEVDFARDCSPTVSAAIAERVRQVLARICEEPVDSALMQADDLLSTELGYCLDSLAFPDLVCNLEKEFGIKVKLRELTGRETVRDVVRLVENKLAALGVPD